MKAKYSIGFFIAVFFFVSCIGVGYQLSYQYVNEKRMEEKMNQTELTESVDTTGTAEKNKGFYLCELHGYVVVYYEDRKTIFEMTEIPVSSLPSEIATQIREGMFIETEEALYSFLENYSS